MLVRAELWRAAALSGHALHRGAPAAGGGHAGRMPCVHECRMTGGERAGRANVMVAAAFGIGAAFTAGGACKFAQYGVDRTEPFKP